jgi:hypothetical protein
VDIEHFAPLCIKSAEMEIEGPGDCGAQEIATKAFGFLAMTEQKELFDAV